MDPNRHHDFLNNNEERSRAAYYGREIPEITSHHYYAPTTTTMTRTVSTTRKPCGCTTTGSGGTTAGCITCNGCRLQPTPDESWPTMASTNQTEHTQRAGGVGDYGRMAAETTVRTNMRQSPMYLPQHQQQQQQPHQQPHQQLPSHGPPSMIQPQQHHPTHVGNMGNRTNYWSQAATSSQSYAEDHLGGIPIQPQIDNSMTRRPAPAPIDTAYGQYKSVSSMPANASHIGSSYPPLPSTSLTTTNLLHHRTSAIGASAANTAAGNTPSSYMTKERIYDHQKYSSSLVSSGKVGYNTTSAANVNSTIYDSHHPHSQQVINQSMSKALPVDHHVINPSNMPASKEQHPSPNYARKCPQMYTPEEQNTAHHNLYMSTPQFSSEKFTRASTQQPPPPDFTKLRESPSGSSYMQQQQHTANDKYNQPHLRESPQYPPQSAINRNHPSSSYYASSSNQNPSKIIPPEMSPIIMKQSHTHYQYSKSPLPPPPAPLPPSPYLQSQQQHQQSVIPPPTGQMAAKINHTNTNLGPPLTSLSVAGLNHPQRYLMDNVKREDLEIYENPNQSLPSRSTTTVGGSGIYINPYNTPPPTGGDNCCKDVNISTTSSPYNTGSATPNYRVESPQFYPTKYGKLAMTEMSINSTKQHSSLINQNTPPPSRAPSQRGPHQANYYYEGNSHSAPSPATATAASPSPSSLMATTTTTSQIHHTEYVTTLQGGPATIGPPPPPPLPLGAGHNMQQSYPTHATSAQHPQQQALTASLRNNDVMMTSHPSTHPYDRAIHQQSLQAQQMATKHVIPQPPSAAASSSSSLQMQAGSANSSKPLLKHQKPNYRELINQKLAMRNATSEEELNMQIIKKTLNKDTPNVRNSPIQQHTMATNRTAAVQHHAAANDRIPIVRDPLRPELIINSSPKVVPSSVLVSHSATPSASRLNELSLVEPTRVCIKQEDDKPSSSTITTTTSPLDLSMRTVKTKADSTEYKYQQRQQQRLNPNTPTSSTTERSSEGRYTLPRVDSTPVFSVHAFEHARAPTTSTNRPATSSRHNSLERRNYTPPFQTPPTAMGGHPYARTTSPHIPASSSQQNYATSRRNDIIPAIPTQPIQLSQGYEKSMVIKSNPKRNTNNNDMDIRPQVPSLITSQTRPSVLETNPYASVIKMENKRISDATPPPAIQPHPLAAVERLPPDTSIMALPPRNPPYTQQRPNLPTNHNTNISSSNNNTTANYSLTCEKNPNFRKRHIEEYSNQMSSMHEPAIKQNRYMELPKHPATPTKAQIHMRPADISVIAVNDNKPMEMERNSLITNNTSSRTNELITTAVSKGVIASPNNATKVIVNNHHQLPSSLAGGMVVCKQEPLTPTADYPPMKLPEVPANNQQINISARIRTKAELKGFTFNPPPPVLPTMQTSTTTTATIENIQTPLKDIIIKQEDLPEVKIKEEIVVTPTLVPQIEMPSIPGLDDVYEERSLLDFGWSNTCNNLVEQLLTRSTPKKKASVVVINKPPKESIEMVVSSTDVKAERKEHTFSNMESADNTTRSSFARLDAGLESSLTFNTINQDSINSQNSGLIHKKLTKSEREKKRFQQEKRLAERLKAKDSSSETEDELDKRKTERLKKPLMKTKHKPNSNSNGQQSNNSNNSSNNQTDKNRFSECGSDSTTTDKEIDQTKTNIKNSPEELEIKAEEIKQEIEEEEEEDPLKEDPKEELKNNEPEKCDKLKKQNEKQQDKKKDIDKTKKSANNNKTEKLTAKKETPPNKPESKKSQNSTNSSTESDEEEENEDNEEEEKGKSSTTTNKSKINTSNKGKFTKQALNTMTRSKRKKELELQLANSKVLRNDKVVRNSSTSNSSSKIKRKYTRKYNSVNSLLESGGLSRESGVMKSTRLKAKLERNGGKLNLMKANKTKASKLDIQSKESSNKLKNPENVHEKNVIDLYRFKRALKVPPSLINIKHPGAHKIAASLPDLERHAEALEAYAKKRKNATIKSNKKIKSEPSSSSTIKKELKNSREDPEEPKSIIDLLHSRVTKASGINVHNKATTTTAFKPTKPCCSTTTSNNNKPPPPSSSCSTSTNNNCGIFSETSQTTESSELQMLPELKKDSEPEEDNDNESTNGKKRHFSIFDTTVLSSKTRTESKLQQKKENIREIFVGDDRPASAPPEITQSSDCSVEKMTYEQKYEQFLQQMNIVISADKFGRLGRSAAARKLLPPHSAQDLSQVNIKQEEIDTESTSVIDADELKTTESMGNHLRKKRGKYLRRKGSSGFDYIRKKKKPTPASVSSNNNLNNGPLSNLQMSIKSEKLEYDEYEHKIKTEDDVSREIQKWVLNKGVGQSTMHKAARQGYIDVIVYCLDRMTMNPDQKDNAGYTPLHEACTNGWLNIARVLLQYGANHSEAAHSGIRPLHEASENDHEEIVRLLLSYGADPLLATYSGQTPLMLASSKTMRDILNNHLIDVQSMGPERKPWQFNGPWEIYDSSECGYNVFEGAPNPICDMSRALLRKGSLANNPMFQNNKKQLQVFNANTTTATASAASTSVAAAAAIASNNLSNATTCNSSTSNDNQPTSSTSCTSIGSSTSNNTSNVLQQQQKGIDAHPQSQQQTKGETTTKTVMDKCAVVLDNIDRFNSVRSTCNDNKSEILVENSDSDGEMFEFEEADILLPPLYLLKDEGTQDKWVLLSDLCNLLKVKSKDTLLNKICPSSSATSSASLASAHKSLMRELKMSDFLEKATCLQLLCAGEKINICASKVVLIKYNESVRNLLGVKTILMKF